MHPSRFAHELLPGDSRAGQIASTDFPCYCLVRNDGDPHPDADERLDDLHVLRFGHDLRRDLLFDEEFVDRAAAVRAGFKQHERLSHQILRNDLLPARERVLRRGDEEQFLAHHWYADETRVVNR